jgi:hypothetical protein
MTIDSDAAVAQEDLHRMIGHRDATTVVVSCICGWSRRILRRQNALSRAAKVRSAWAEHEREIAAKRTT